MTDVVELFVAPLRYPFFVRGLLAAALVGVVCASVGTFVVLRGMAFFGDALAHAILPGVAIGFILGDGQRGLVFGGALVAALVTAVAIGLVFRGASVREDTAIGIVFAAMFALGIALISLRGSYAVDLAHLLFGDVLGVSTTDLWRTGALTVFILAAVFAFYKEFVLLSFDPVLAETLRLPATSLYFALLTLIALTVVAALQTVGVALTVAMLVTPPATAALIARRLPAMIALAACIGAASGVLGLYSSYYADIPSGAAIVLVATLLFAITLAGRRISASRRVAGLAEKRHSV